MAACEARGRDPESIIFSVAQVVCCGTDEAELARRAAAIGREVAELRDNGVAGLPEECAARILAMADAGVTRVYLQVLDDTDTDHLRLIADQVAPMCDR